MSRLTGSEARGLMEAYNSIFHQTEVEMHVVKEEGLDEDTNSDIKNFFKKATKELTKEIESKANYIRGGADNIGSAVSGIGQGMGFPDLEKVGRSAEKIIGSGGGTAKTKEPATAKPEPAKPKPQKEKGGVQLEATAVVAPRGQRVGVQTPGKPETWKPIEDPTDPRIAKYKKSRGSAQLAKDKAAQAQARKSALQLAADEKATPKDEFAQARRKPDGDPASRPRREPPTAKPQPTPKPPAPAQTGDRTKDLTTWAKANKPMIQKVGTPQQRAVLSAAEKGTAMPAPRPISKEIEDLKGMQKASQERQAAQSGPMYSSPDVKSKMSLRTQRMLGLTQDSYDLDAYDLVLEYLFSQGHVDTVDEAHYVMLQMDAEHIQNIVEAEVLTMKGGVPGSVKVKPALSIPGTDIGIGPNKPVPGTFTTTTPGQREKIAKGDTTIDRGTYQQSRVGAGPTSAERQRYNTELIRQGKHTAPRMPQ